MPKITKELTALEVKHLGYGTFSIGGVKGLYIRKTPHQQFFFLRYKDESGRHDYALGNYPEVSVAQARKAAADARASIAKGTNPIDERQSERAARLAAKQAAQAELEQKKQTFEKIANEWVEDRVNHGYWSKNHRGEKTLAKSSADTFSPLSVPRTLIKLLRRISGNVCLPFGSRRRQRPKKHVRMLERSFNGRSHFINERIGKTLPIWQERSAY